MSVRMRFLPAIATILLVLGSCARQQALVEGHSGPSEVVASPSAFTDTLCVLRGWEIESIDVGFGFNGDTIHQGRPYREALGNQLGYASERSWYATDAAIPFRGRMWKKVWRPLVLGRGQIERADSYDGVPIFVARGDTAVAAMYVPVSPGCVFQPYFPSEAPGGARGT